jgi:hypothetical protein
MNPGHLRVKRTKKTTIFEVHRWPETIRLPRVCSSVCAFREVQGTAATLGPKWKKTDDADKVAIRLAATEANGPSGADKGRVIFVFDRTPLHGEHRVVAVGLLSVRKSGVFQLYRVCFNDDLIEEEHGYVLRRIVACAKALADDAGATLEMLVPPGAKAGELKIALSFRSTRTGERRQSWLVS